jgi:hypothetical protein
MKRIMIRYTCSKSAEIPSMHLHPDGDYNAETPLLCGRCRKKEKLIAVGQLGVAEAVTKQTRLTQRCGDLAALSRWRRWCWLPCCLARKTEARRHDGHTIRESKRERVSKRRNWGH